MRENKLFVKAMIITALVGLTSLMVILFIGVRWFVDEKTPDDVYTQQPEVEVPVVPFNSTILGVVEAIEGDKIQLFDIEKRQKVEAIIEPMTAIKDAYGKVMPKETLSVGSIVALVYEPKEDRLLEVSTAIQAWIKTEMKVAQLDQASRTIKIGASTYKYNDNTVIFDKAGNRLTNYDVGVYDVLELKGIDDNVYSIQVLEKQGYLELLHIPSNEGVVEINLNRQIPMGSVTGPIPIASGNHEIVIRVQGYQPVRQKIKIEPDATTTVDLDALEKAITRLTLQLPADVTAYTLTIGGVDYTGTMPIEITSGAYDIEIKAEGYKTWKQHLLLNELEMSVTVLLEKKAGLTTTPGVTTTPEGDTESGETGQTTPPTHYKVAINTEPAGADVYIDGKHKGQTPYTVELELGMHTIQLKKEGYETYETTIQLDHSDTQNNYLYRLIPSIP